MIILAGIVLIAGFVYWRLHVTNMELPPNVERRLSARQALQFAVDNDLPIK